MDPTSNPIWSVFAAIGFAILATILIFMDQQITAVIVNRKEHKLKVSQHNMTLKNFGEKLIAHTDFVCFPFLLRTSFESDISIYSYISGNTEPTNRIG